MDWSKDDVLSALDGCCGDFTFPMLDNGYVYLAATRLSAFHSPVDWALTIEVFGFSPRSGIPDTCVHTFGSRIVNRRRADEFVSPRAHSNYLAQNQHNDSHFVFPIENQGWQDPEDPEILDSHARELLLRGGVVPMPTIDECRRHGVNVEDDPRIQVFELCRTLAATHRDEVLATTVERRFHVPRELDQILQLEEWNHPDVVDEDKRPSGNETFVQLAKVLVSGDKSRYRPSAESNTHWRNWPGGGML